GAGPAPAWGLRQPRARLEGFVRAEIHASYLHTHPAGLPEAAARFVARAAGAGPVTG
ncbi:cobyrinic acid a,c-diamide synthase, partial [Streptomyces sp. NEAU-H3]|nr:cobyrinic acid a,c-diamide synthase [Streptomyces sp. NEAU-H3]